MKPPISAPHDLAERLNEMAEAAAADEAQQRQFEEETRADEFAMALDRFELFDDEPEPDFDDELHDGCGYEDDGYDYDYDY